MLQARTPWLALLLLTFAGTAFADTPADVRVISSDDGKWLVSDAEMILKWNIKLMMNSELVKKIGPDTIKQAISNNERIKPVLEATGLDVTRDLDSILISASGGSAKDVKARIVIRGKFDVEKIAEALKKQSEKSPGVKVLKEGSAQMYEFLLQEDQALYGGFADARTLVLTQSKEATADLLKNPPSRAATMNARMKEATGKLSGKESVVMALVINDDVKKMLGNARGKMGETAAKLQALTASLILTDGMAVNIKGQTSDAEAAGQMAKLLEGFKATGALALGNGGDPILTELLNAVKIASAKDSVAISLVIPKETINKLPLGDK